MATREQHDAAWHGMADKKAEELKRRQRWRLSKRELSEDELMRAYGVDPEKFDLEEPEGGMALIELVVLAAVTAGALSRIFGWWG